MVSIRRPWAPSRGQAPSSRGTAVRCPLIVAVALALVAVLGTGLGADGTGGLGAPSAAAEPAPPNANETVRALSEANSRAAAATEFSMGAQEALTTRRAAADRARRDAGAARVRADGARGERDRAFVGVDQLTRAAYQGGDLDQLSALLGSDSPQSYLDKVSLLDSVSTQNQAQVQRFLDAATAAEAAQRDVDARLVDADRAAQDAERSARDAADRKVSADRDIAVATAALRRARPADLAALRGPAGPRIAPTSLPGGGIAMEALRAALTQQGKPYVWGATGSDSYDCSGLTYWAYRQVGVQLPRTAEQQSQVGTPIDPQNAQVGDLVFFNEPVTHMGIYVGNGLMLNAPQSGDVVKVAKVQRNLTGIRRIST